MVGVGIEKTAAKLEKETGLLIQRRVELRDLAKEQKSLQGQDFSRYDVQRLARAVLGEEYEFQKPNKIKWWSVQPCDMGSENWEVFSNDMVKYATIED